MEYSFRNCTLEDFNFLFELKKENFKWYVEIIWGWQDEQQKEFLKQQLKEHMLHTKIILINNEPCGVYITYKTESGDLFIDEISVLKKYQNKGIGRKILEQQLKDNKKNKIKTLLQVYKENPAKRLYDKLGFEVCGETPTHYKMEKKY